MPAFGPTGTSGTSVDEAILLISEAVQAGDRRAAVLACSHLDDAVLVEGAFAVSSFERLLALLRHPALNSGAFTWRILKSIENNIAEFSLDQKQALRSEVMALKRVITDPMAHYMADELLTRSLD